MVDVRDGLSWGVVGVVCGVLCGGCGLSFCCGGWVLWVCEGGLVVVI